MAGVSFVSSRVSKPLAASTRLRFYRPELDLLRFLAFLMVWCAHASLSLRGLVPAKAVGWVNGVGSLGVPAFFFLSAYLITELLRRERAQTGTIAIRKFYIRRILRIWPLYFGILAVYGLLGIWFHGFRIEPGRLLASCLMVGNWYIGHHPGLTTPLRHLWSISVEEQWYLLWPLLVLALPRRLLLPACAVIFCVSQGVLLGCADAAAQPNAVWVSSGVQAQYLAEGAALALVLGGRIPPLRAATRALLMLVAFAAFLAAVGVFGIRLPAEIRSPLSVCGGYLSAGLGSACLFFSLLGLDERRLPALFVWLGRLSYGLYVLHETGFFLAGVVLRRLCSQTSLHRPALLASLPLSFLITTALAVASYFLWERPFLRLKERWVVIRSRTPA
jgi:peptidoglycan/LPS O-acetylase OafA/YrhL